MSRQALLPRGKRVWGLSSHLAALLMVTLVLTFGGVGASLVLWRIPMVDEESRDYLARDIVLMTERLELLLSTRQRARLELTERLLRGMAPAQAVHLLEDTANGSRLFSTVHLLSPEGVVLASGGVQEGRTRRLDLKGADLSNNALFRAALARAGMVWSNRYFSALSGAPAVGVALRGEDGRVLLAEVSSEAMLEVVESAAAHRYALAWIVDRSGEVIADARAGIDIGRLNLYDWPMLQALRQGGTPQQALRFEGRLYHAAAVHAPSLGWYVVAGVPAGWSAPRVQTNVRLIAVGVVGCLLVGLVACPFWVRRLGRPLQDIVARAAQTTAGGADERPWPHGSVAEYNRLSTHLQTMAATLRERQQWFLAIFNAAPVPMGVADATTARIIDVNEAWCRELGRPREGALGRSAMELGLWSSQERARVLAQERDGRIDSEAEILRGDGQPLLMQLFGRRVELASRRLLVWAMVDVGPMRRVERELRELNLELEQRVAQRTEALTRSNAELSQVLAQLHQAQDGLVQAEKMAALGALVASVAHELNTPLGNSVMAVGALEDGTRRFARGMSGGLRRADLQAWLDSIAQGCDIAGRNLRRAAELVQHFKQVAVDRTSAQRRRFELHEVVHEMVVSLRPSFARTPFRIEVDVPAEGLALDSYPGALGQVIGNLIQNAVLHAFDGRAHGTVRIGAQADGEDAVVVRVADDGKGIAAEHLEHIFEPFMTTRRGRGGSGLGLHISQTAVTDLLGGTLTVHSIEGEGTCFELRLPTVAPRAAA